jgi:hypothetical protein
LTVEGYEETLLGQWKYFIFDVPVKTHSVLKKSEFY